MSGPLVSVIMPVYNSERYLTEAITSILSQTYSNFELLITDDCSTDASRQIVAEFAALDRRIIAHYSKEHSGYVVHLNESILRARGEYIARMDSDDVSLPERFALQVDFLQRHPEVAVVGSSSIRISDDGKELGMSRRNTSPAALLWQSFFTNPLSHPSVMFRRSVIIQTGLYNPEKMPAEDFDLWTRVLRLGRLANIGQFLLKYRIHTTSVSSRKKELQSKNSTQSLYDHWSFFCDVRISDTMLYFLKNYHKGCELQPVDDTRAAYYLIVKLYLKLVFVVGFDRHIERDAFGKLYYLVSRSRQVSVSTFFELSVILAFLFPLMILKRLITK